jgi:hypothetical protein
MSETGALSLGSGKLLLGAKGEAMRDTTECTSSISQLPQSRDIAGRCNTLMITFGTWVMLCQGFLPAATLASRNEGNVAPINATELFFLQAFKNRLCI